MPSRWGTKLLYGAGAYTFSSLFCAPEMVNPYYTTYILTHRFPASRTVATENDLYIRRVWSKLSDYGGSAYAYMRDLVVDPSPPATAVATTVPVVSTDPVLTPTTQVVTQQPQVVQQTTTTTTKP